MVFFELISHPVVISIGKLHGSNQFRDMVVLNGVYGAERLEISYYGPCELTETRTAGPQW